jgi:hypothetical protein
MDRRTSRFIAIGGLILMLVVIAVVWAVSPR